MKVWKNRRALDVQIKEVGFRQALRLTHSFVFPFVCKYCWLLVLLLAFDIDNGFYSGRDEALPPT